MSDYTSWHVGMKVVCVDDSPMMTGGKSLTRGEVYTLRKIGRDDRIRNRRFGQIDVWLDEVRRPKDLGYGALRFRPVQTRKTDISIFTRLLNPHPTRETA